MERLTKRWENSQAVMNCETCKLRETCCTALSCRNQLKDRLAAYEDTGLSPEDCRNYKIFEDEVVSKGITFQRIIQLMEAAAIDPQDTGRWEQSDDGDGIICPECREDFCTMTNETERFYFCPNCGNRRYDNGKP